MIDATASTSTASAAIRDFAAAVREQLSDLPMDDIDDLTDGLEADLTEQAADAAAADGGTENNASTSPERGDPVAYAAELRSAADLPPRRAPAADAHREPLVRRLGARARARQTDAARSIRTSATGAGLLDFLIVLRPLWWVSRGWAVYAVAIIVLGSSAGFVPTDPVGVLVLTGFVTLSVQWGRGLWLPWRWLAGFRALVSVCAIVALPLLVMVAAHQPNWQGDSSAAFDPSVSPGLVQNGHEVTNIFAYDVNGQSLADVQLFDQDGNPMNVVSDPADKLYLSQYDAEGNERRLVPSRMVPGGSGWNVYPLRQVPSRHFDSSLDASGQVDQADARPSRLPFPQVQPLVAAPESGEPSASPTSAALAPDSSPAPESPAPGADAPESTPETAR